jgi:hypothetical protein
LTASDGATTDLFGRPNAVAISNTQILVGNNKLSGAAYLFATTIQPNKNDTNNRDYYSQMAKITANEMEEEDRFGVAVDIDGDWLVIGAPGTINYTGAAFLFRRSVTDNENPFTEMAKITASDGVAGDNFGVTVAIQANFVLVGAYDVHSSDSHVNAGSAYLFAINLDQNGTGSWQQIFQFQVDDPVDNGRFGVSLAMDGNLAVIGAVGADAAYIFEKVDNTTDSSWTQVAKLVPGVNDLTSRTFGYATAMAGNWVVVGAHRDRNINGDNAGAAFVFKKTSNASDSWTQVNKLIAEDGAANDSFGTSVAISKDASTIVVGADLADFSEEIVDSGAMYLFSPTKVNGTWSQTGKFVASDKSTGDNLGISVALEDNILAVGAPLDDVNNERDVGSVYVVELTAPNNSTPNDSEPSTNLPTTQGTDPSGLSQGAIIALAAIFGCVVVVVIVASLIHKKWKLQQQHKQEMLSHPPLALDANDTSPPLIAEMVTAEPPAMAEVVILPEHLPSTLDRTIEADAIVDDTTAKESFDTSVGTSLQYKDQVRSVAEGPQRLPNDSKKSQRSDGYV